MIRSALPAFALALLAGAAQAQAPAPGSGVSAADRATIASCIRDSGELPRGCIGAIAVPCTRQPGASRDGAEVACFRREAAVWRERLDFAASTLAQRLESGARSRLGALQRSWESDAAQKCAFAAEIEPPARAASMQAGCELREAALRALELERLARRQAGPAQGRPELHR